MTKTFQEAFIDAIASGDNTLATIASGSGVALAHLEALKEHASTQTSLDDATKIAAFFGASLEAFLGDPDLQGPIEIVGLYNQLPDRLKRQFQVYEQGQPGSRDPSEKE